MFGAAVITMRKFFTTFAFASLAVAAFGQASPGRTFTYSTTGTSTFLLEDATATGSKTGTATAPSMAGNVVSVPLATGVKPKTYLYVSGAFNKEVSVVGFGAASQTTPDVTWIDIRSNRKFSVSFADFTKALSGTDDEGVTISYVFELWKADQSSKVFDLASGTDTALNSAAGVEIKPNDLDDGQGFIKFTRSISVTKNTLGDKTYTATGKMLLTIN